jgi:hypothetical protein
MGWPWPLDGVVGTGYADLTTFLEAVRDIDLDYIREGVDIWTKEDDAKKKEQDTRNLKKELEEQEDAYNNQRNYQRPHGTTSPANVVLQHRKLGPAAQSSTTNTSHGPTGNLFTSNAGGRGNLFYPTQAQNNTSRPTAMQADRAALLICLQKYPHHPDTEAGRQAHQAQQAEWAQTHGLSMCVSEMTPYPLRPGTLPVDSGECFTCGFTGHMGRRDGSTCGGNRALHPHKQMWQAISARILRQTQVAATSGKRGLDLEKPRHL